MGVAIIIYFLLFILGITISIAIFNISVWLSFIVFIVTIRKSYSMVKTLYKIFNKGEE